MSPALTLRERLAAAPRQPVRPPAPVSPWVRRALARELPTKVYR